MTTKEQMHLNCLAIEALVKAAVIKGMIDNTTLVSLVDDHFHPETKEEMETYSEAIVYAKLGVLN